MHTSFLTLLGLLLLAGGAARHAAHPAEASALPMSGEDTAWEAVREVLSSRCLSCHGGDARKSGLSFADQASFLEGGLRGPVFSADDWSASRLLSAIRYGDPDLSMPPSGQLPAAERELLEDWLESGAPWPEGAAGELADPKRHSRHARPRAIEGWAYAPLRETTPAPTAGQGAPSHPIDAFQRAALAKAGLKPAPQAEADVLFRRGQLDLLGLPPTSAERAHFAQRVADLGFEAAWSEQIETWLGSPHYGEHWARHWLDLVRYAETNGYERDGTKRFAWRYRDWVVRALNRDLPYDRFLMAQLAGDEAPASEQLGADAPLATGFLRLGVWDDEPSDPEQARADELADIVDTTANVFLAATLGCARCHDHKADPLTQRDYYSFSAFFNNLVGYGGGGFGQHLGGGATRDWPDTPGPGVLSPAELNARLADLESQLAEAARQRQLPAPRRADNAESARVTLVPDARSGGAEFAYWLEEAPAEAMQPGFDDRAWPRGRGGFGAAGTPGARLGTAWHSAEISLRTTFALEAIPEAVTLSLHHDDDVQIYLNGRELLRRTGYRLDYAEIALDQAQRSLLVTGRNVLSLRCRQDFGGQYIDVGLFTGAPRPTEEEGVEDWLSRLRASVEQEPASAERERVLALMYERERCADLPRSAPYPAQVAFENGPNAPQQYVLGRGSVHAPGEAVEPTIPAAFLATAGPGATGVDLPTPDPAAASSGRRLALARWLVGEGRAATARAMANRLWQFHFGRGLCPTPGDFGRLGLPPTHPELLDYLAQQLIEQGWSLKAMHRLLMTSAAYRMDSRGAAETLASALAQDAQNRLLWRFEPRRMSAEQYRDSLLRVAGVLHGELFGPSIYPELAADVLATSSRPEEAWGHSSQTQERRRSLYVFVKRSLRPPLLEALDQPSPDLPCPERFPTNVPTQALMTMNGAFPAEMASALAASLEQALPSDAERVKSALESALGRSADEQEIQRHLDFMAALQNEENLSPRESLEVFCLALFNLNEFLWID